jgi:hypothetical protein
MSKNVQKIGTNLSKTCEFRNFGNLRTHKMYGNDKLGGAKKRTSQAVYKKKTYYPKKRSFVRYRPVLVNVGNQPFPLQYKATLKYVQYQIPVYASGNTVFQFSCNGLYNPNSTYGGTQPLYFDQLMAIYNHYTVVSSKCKTTINPLVAMGTGVSLVLTGYIDDDTNPAVVGDPNLAMQRPGAKTSSGSRQVAKPIYLYWSAAKTFGGNPLGDPSMTGTVSANPAEMSHFTFSLFDFEGGSGTCGFLTEIEYTVVFDELKSMTAS